MPSNVVLIEGKGHTSFLMEDPMRGGRDLLAEMLVRLTNDGQEAELHEYPTLCPSYLCTVAGRICPF